MDSLRLTLITRRSTKQRTGISAGKERPDCREADAAPFVAADPVAGLPDKAARCMAEIPAIALNTHESETTRIAKIVFITATAGIHAEGTIYRTDSVPIRIRKVRDSQYPSDDEVLGRLLARVKELKAC